MKSIRVKRTVTGLPGWIAEMRFNYHGALLDLNNVLNQLGLRSDLEAEKKGKYHTMTMLTDCLPQMGYDVSEIFKETD